MLRSKSFFFSFQMRKSEKDNKENLGFLKKMMSANHNYENQPNDNRVKLMERGNQKVGVVSMVG